MLRIEFNPKFIVLSTLFLIIVGYALFQSRFIILGPQITITYPQDAERLLEPVFRMEGKAKNISWLTLNGNQIFTDEDGVWSERLAAKKGVSIMTVRAGTASAER